MSDQSLARRMTAADASFLYLERQEAPMHIGGAGVFAGDVDAAGFKLRLAKKLHLLPRFTQCVTPAPFNLAHPTWETDLHFDIDRHVFEHWVDAPGDERAFMRKAGQIETGMLDRGKPLWEIHLVRGLAEGHTGVVTKLHHAMVDGVSGMYIMTAMFDTEREPAEAGSKAGERTGEGAGATQDQKKTGGGAGSTQDKTKTGGDAGSTQAQSTQAGSAQSQALSQVDRLVEALWDNTTSFVDLWSDYQRGMIEATRSFDVDQAQKALSVMRQQMPNLSRPVQRLPFNRACSGERLLAWSEFSFAEARAIRQALCGTLNDVALTVLTGAIRRYALKHKIDLKDRSLRIMAPVNVRASTEGGALGNRVSVLPVDIPLSIADPGERLKKVNETTMALKEANVAQGIYMVTNLMSAIPAAFQAAFGQFAMAPFPVFNLVATNVPGPQIPLYALGHEMIHYYPYVPIGFEMGLGCAIISYNQRLAIGLTADAAAAPDVYDIKQFLDEEYYALRKLAGVGEIEAVKIRKRKTKVAEKGEKGQGEPAKAVGAGAASASGTGGRKREK